MAYILNSNFSVGQSASGVGGSSTTSIQRTTDTNYNPNQSYNPPYGGSTLADDKIDKAREEKISNDNAPIQFPSDLGTDYYISFNAFAYSQDRPKDSKRSFTFHKTINLPLPGNLTDNYSSNYKQEDLFVIGNAVREGMTSLIANGTVQGLENITPNSIGQAASKGMNYLANNKKELAATIGVLALSGTGGQLASAAKSSLQLTTNPFPVMIFQGTNFKPAFTFDWTFYPETFEEAKNIKKIIGFFRREMLPEKMEGNNSILKTPSIFEIKVTPSESLRKFKRCVLTNMGVNYAPAGVSFVKDSKVSALASPTATSVSLTFQEIEVWLADDYSRSEELNFDPIER